MSLTFEANMKKWKERIIPLLIDIEQEVLKDKITSVISIANAV